MWPFSLCTTSTVGCPGSSQRPTSSWNGIVAAAMRAKKAPSESVDSAASDARIAPTRPARLKAA